MKYKHIKTLTKDVSMIEYQTLTCIMKCRKGSKNEASILRRLNKHGVKGVPRIIPYTDDTIKQSTDKDDTIKQSTDKDDIIKQSTDKDDTMICSYQQGEDLFDYINNRFNIKLDHIKTIFKQVVSIVKEAHDKQIFHRDIKLENIIVEEKKNNTNDIKFIVSIIDWEFSAKFGTKDLKLSGTMEYIAPEAITLTYIGPENDIWSLGILLYFLLEGRFPWKIDDTFLEDPHYDKFLSELIYKFDIDYDNIKHKDYIPLYKAIFVPYKERCSLDYIISCIEQIS